MIAIYLRRFHATCNMPLRYTAFLTIWSFDFPLEKRKFALDERVPACILLVT